MGVGVGCAIAGKRPIMENMFMDFVKLAMSQLVNHAAKLHYMSGGQLSVPMVIRVQQGAVGAWGARNAAYYAAEILGLNNEEIRQAYEDYRRELRER